MKRLKTLSSRIQKKANLWLILICLFFLISRLYQISDNPSSFYWDEASIGYNAYSILHTGKDEWGKAFPIHFRAFGEFKLPVYIYSAVVTEAVFGLTPLGVRLPAVLYSLGSLLLIYFLVKKITQKELPALFSAFSFAIMPWMFIFSRTGYEATAGMFYFLLAVQLFLISTQKKYFLLFSVISLIASIYSYNSFRLISGLTIIVAVGYSFWSSRTKKTFLICVMALLMFAISTIPIIRLLLFDAGFGRVEAFSLLPNIQQVYDIKGNPQFQIIYDRNHATIWTDNLKMVARNYFSHFSPQFLFFQGDQNPRSQQPGLGQLYYLDFPFLLLGLYMLFKVRKFYFFLVAFLLFISPIPASLFRESPHALRSVLTAPILAIIIGLGIGLITMKRKFLIVPVIALYLIFFGNYYFNFLTSYQVKASADWQYGYKQIYEIYGSQFGNYDKILISDHDAQPYIFPLVYLKVDPTDFQKNAQRNSVDNWGFSTIASFDKFQFGKVDKLAAKDTGKLLIFASDEDKLGNLPDQSEIKFLNGKTAYYVYTLQK